MTFDLILGFYEKPADLAETLAQLGFKHERSFPKGNPNDVTMEFYGYFKRGRSKGGVSLTYHDGTYPDHDESWKNIVDKPDEIVATGSLITTMGRNTYDETKQWELGRFLRDYYEAVLYDPQAGRTITD